MAVIQVKNSQDGDTYICDAYNDWAESQRYYYTPYLHQSGKWRIKTASQIIDEDGNVDNPDVELEHYYLRDSEARLQPDNRIAEFETKDQAIHMIRKETYYGKTGPVPPRESERRYERESEYEIRRLVAEED